MCTQRHGRGREDLAECTCFDIIPRGASLRVIEGYGGFPDKLQPFPFALRDSRIIDPRNRLKIPCDVTNPTFPATSKTVVGAGFDVETERVVTGSLRALRTRRALLGVAGRSNLHSEVEPIMSWHHNPRTFLSACGRP